MCKTDYNFVAYKSYRNYNKSYFDERSQSTIDIPNRELLEPTKNFSTLLPKHIIIHHNVTPSPNKYSMAAMDQKQLLLGKIGKAYKFSTSKVDKCDFFYPYPKKEFTQNFHHNLDAYAHNSMSEAPVYSFGKNQSRDAASHIKSVVGILNEMKAQKDL